MDCHQNTNWSSFDPETLRDFTERGSPASTFVLGMRNLPDPFGYSTDNNSPLPQSGPTPHTLPHNASQTNLVIIYGLNKVAFADRATLSRHSSLLANEIQMVSAENPAVLHLDYPFPVAIKAVLEWLKTGHYEHLYVELAQEAPLDSLLDLHAHLYLVACRFKVRALRIAAATAFLRTAHELLCSPGRLLLSSWPIRPRSNNISIFNTRLCLLGISLLWKESNCLDPLRVRVLQLLKMHLPMLEEQVWWHVWRNTEFEFSEDWKDFCNEELAGA